MNQRGRKSSAALTVLEGSIVTRLVAPSGLSDGELGVWQATVESKPADWFGLEHIPILVEYVRAVCRGHVIDGQIRGFEPEWFETPEGLQRYQRLSEIANKTASMVNRLATTMRITQQSSYRADKVIPRAGKKLWQRNES